MSSGRPDVVIVGGGLIGGSLALELARRALRVVVVERGEPMGEASGAAAGILAPQAETDGPGALFDLLRASLALYPRFVEDIEATTGLDVGYQATGAIEVALDEAGADRLVRRATWQRALGLHAEPLTRAAVRDLEPLVTDEVVAGLLLPEEARIDPRRLGRAVWLAALAAGVRSETGDVRRVRVEGGIATGVEVDGRRIEGGALVIAAGAWSALIGERLLPATAVTPLRGQLVDLDLGPGLGAAGRRLRRIVFGPDGYLLPRADGLVRCGATSERAGFRKAVTASGISSVIAAALRLAPGLRDAPLHAAWAGLRPASADGLPLLGPHGTAGNAIQRLWLATGHQRNGLLLAPITAAAVAAAILGETPPVSLAPFSLARFAPTKND